MEEHKLELVYENLNPSDLVRESVARMDAMSKSKGLQIVEEFSLPSTDDFFHGDRDILLRVLQNLLSNAINYSSGRGEIRISTKLAGDDYRVEIHDQGIGMTLEQVSNIFEKFYRVNGSDTAPMGTGLGMSIVKLIIDAHRGKIWESQPKKGTRVIFTLPVGSETQDRAKEEDSGEINIKGKNRRGRRI